jgi:hypothetical protein
MAEIYKQVNTTLAKDWDIQDGPTTIKEDQAQGDRVTFISRNKQLYEMIVSGIQKSDVFIADVTNANSNVMIELGIAIQLNKNVIIITGQDINRLPFDIQGFKADKYDNVDKLISIIKDQLSIYLDIKKQNFDKYFPESYTSMKGGSLTANNAVIPIALSKPIKNLRLRIEYKFINVSDDIDWLGIHLRASPVSVQPSELVYVRKNGSLEVVTLPTGRPPVPSQDKENKENIMSDDFTRLELILDGNKLLAATSTKELSDESIQLESLGNIYLQANGHNQEKRDNLSIEFRNVEVISLDTISPI